MQRQLRLALLAVSIALLVLFALVPNSHVKAQDQQGSIVGTWIHGLLRTP